MRVRRLLAVMGVLAVLFAVTPSAAAQMRAFPGVDCTESPTPDMPGQGLSAFFENSPNPLPRQADPFAPGSQTTMYEQYGYAGLRWHTYDLGCGPDAARDPDAVMGTALSNWLINIPVSMSALTASITDVAFNPTFLNVFDPAITRISSALHSSLFATWVPAVLALLGIAILIKARRSALATTAAAVGWALMVVLVATAIFRWPLAAGHVADDTVTSTLGSVVSKVDGRDRRVSPSVAVASNVQESIFYRSWLAGTLGSTDSETSRKYGPRLFKAQALTWHESYVVQHDPARGKSIIESKQDDWKTLASQIKADDPTAYEHLQGKRSDTRIGYAFLSTVAAVLALPFLLVAALLLLGSFLIVRLAVMMFPAFATLGVFPAGRGLVLGIGRTVGAALVNAVVFGIGAAVTIRVLGIILDPASHIPGWLAFTLMPLFGLVMWVALKPFRRLTSMVSPRNVDPFGDAAGALGGAARSTGRWAKKVAVTAAGVYTGNVAAAATVNALDDNEEGTQAVPDRVEAHSSTYDAGATTAPSAASTPALESTSRPSTSHAPEGPTSDGSMSGSPHGPQDVAGQSWETTPPPYDAEEGRGFPPAEAEPVAPIEPEWVDGEEVYTVYRPASEDADDAA